VKATIYDIEVRGALPASLCAELPGFHQRRDAEGTVLTGPVADAAALYGLLARLETLGVTLVAVRPVPDTPHT
jgi:hypothetical protein